MKKIILVATVFFTLVSCKKTYECECTNSNGTYVAGEIEDTKSKARKNCQSLNSGDTKCNLK